MATKTSATKETVLKTTTAAPASEKKSAVKASKAVVSAPELPAAETTKSPNTAQATPPVVQTAPTPPPATAQDQKWQEIRLILEKLKEDTLREIRKSVKNGTEAVAAIEPGGDIYDQASSERDRELGLLLGDREREKIHSIDEALLRIDDGEYGICEECDEDIPLGRLKAMPFTRHCVKCKSDLEKLQAQTKRVEEERAYREIPIGSEDEE
jgi:DnaK suppressor protein